MAFGSNCWRHSTQVGSGMSDRADMVSYLSVQSRSDVGEHSIDPVPEPEQHPVLMDASSPDRHLPVGEGLDPDRLAPRLSGVEVLTDQLDGVPDSGAERI